MIDWSSSDTTSYYNDIFYVPETTEGIFLNTKYNTNDSYCYQCPSVNNSVLYDERSKSLDLENFSNRRQSNMSQPMVPPQVQPTVPYMVPPQVQPIVPYMVPPQVQPIVPYMVPPQVQPIVQPVQLQSHVQPIVQPVQLQSQVQPIVQPVQLQSQVQPIVQPVYIQPQLQSELKPLVQPIQFEYQMPTKLEPIIQPIQLQPIVQPTKVEPSNEVPKKVESFGGKDTFVRKLFNQNNMFIVVFFIIVICICYTEVRLTHIKRKITRISEYETS